LPAGNHARLIDDQHLATCFRLRALLLEPALNGGRIREALESPTRAAAVRVLMAGMRRAKETAPNTKAPTLTT